MKDTKIQWHPAFAAAMELELKEDWDSLEFQREYNLNTKPLEIDLLVIKKEKSAKISNEIGRAFRGHNILEYKSAKDHLNIDTYFKAVAYASLYKSYGKAVDAVKEDDITISLIREVKPEGLFRYFGEHGYAISPCGKGIYQIKGKTPFLTQVIVIKELEKGNHIWLMSLSGRLGKSNIEELVGKIQALPQKRELELAASVLEVSVAANRESIGKMKGEHGMYEALMEFLKPMYEMREKECREEGLREGLQTGVHGAVDVLRELGHGDAEIREAITRQYALTEEEAETYMQN